MIILSSANTLNVITRKEYDVYLIITLWIVLTVSAVTAIIGFLMCLHYLLCTPTNPTAQLPIGKRMIMFGGIGIIVSVLALVVMKYGYIPLPYKPL